MPRESQQNDTVSFGNTELKVIFAPGHAPGHIVFYDEKGKNLIAGDVLFQRSIGRTDLACVWGVVVALNIVLSFLLGQRPQMTQPIPTS